MPKKVYVGMSGGVDSSVSAALLKQAGYDVTGVFIKVWEPDNFDCDWRAERREAMRAASVLDIPFITLDLSDEYKKEVVDYMIAEYRAGRTPNPDVMCNKSVKFGAFYRRARQAGADFIATGHYARVVTSHELRVTSKMQESQVFVIPVEARIQSSEPKFQMLAGSDQNKDQSYFLWTLDQDILAHTLFPIGHLQKSEVRGLAKKFGLPNAEKKDSQGLCFVGKLNVKSFLQDFIKTEEGKVLNPAGEVIGRHPGSLFFTIGERRGFEITKKGASDAPYYIVDKDVKNNTITVSMEPEIYEKENKNVMLESVNWISGVAPEVGKTYQARIRYRQPLQSCQMNLQKASPSGTKGEAFWNVRFNQAQKAITSGQSLVLYDEDICLGGGVIK